ncbi:hypothetical protein DOY81_002700 [Sarcophaga bullata]|nr:hypothetical protein DOY81_002700 [Sarcophaga bullata]
MDLNETETETETLAEESNEIFKDCSNKEIKQENFEDNSPSSFSSHDLNQKQQQQHQQFEEFTKYTKNNNNHHQHIVPVGIIIVVMTIYLGISSIPKCLVSCVEDKHQPEHKKKDILMDLYKTENKENSLILDRLLEYKDICKDLEIFTKDKDQTKSNKEPLYDMLNDIETLSDSSGDTDVYDNEEQEGSNLATAMDDGSANNEASASGSGSHCLRELRTKNKKSKYSIKSTNHKNGFNKYNKSSKAKYNKNNNNKKEINLNKKNSTAEPIIYLFALVFIYLLLKAASDINQHYKYQNKNDKRLRRCSLQSYAQTHRPDRRASKELALKQKQQQQQQQRLKSLSRTPSQDQQYHHHQHHAQVHQQPKQHLMATLLQKTEQLQQQQQQQQQQQHQHITSSPVRPKKLYSSNWQLLRQHTNTQSLDNSDLLTNTIGGMKNQEFSSSLMARRCSVPVAALNYQRQIISSHSPLSTVSDHHHHHSVSGSLSRRTSLAMDPNESFLPETKRRVRMINRH